MTDLELWTSLITLTVLEIVLGIDNIIFMAILAGRLPLELQARARQIGLALAVVTRLGLLLALSWVAGLTRPLCFVAGHEFSGRDMILIAGGLFLLAKSAHEIHQKLECPEEGAETPRMASTFASVIAQILVLDVVFSLDSVITAVGMATSLKVMMAAVVLAVGVMMWAAGPIAQFVDRRPSVKMLALSFLLLIGFSLLVEGFDHHIPKGYIYFSMAFSAFVEWLNLRAGARRLQSPASI